jgi:hypothetical protein
MLLAARAAVEARTDFVSADGRPLSTSDMDGDYQHDDDQVKAIAHQLGVSPFAKWRKQMLKRAQDIVSIPYVSRSILSVAFSLELERRMHEMKLGNGRVSATKVRGALRWS